MGTSGRLIWSRIGSWVYKLALTTPSVLSVVFFWVWYEQYLAVEFNEAGRYYDPQDHVVHTDAAFVWGIPALGFLLLAAILAGYRIWRRRLRKRMPGAELADVCDR